MTTASKARSIRRRGSSSAGKKEPSRSLGILSSTSPALSTAAAIGCRCGARCAARSVHRAEPRCAGWLDLDQRLEHQSQPFADDVQVTAGAQCIQQLGQGRLAKGHRGELLGVNPGRNTLSFTRWPSPCYSAEQGLPQSPPLPGTPTISSSTAAYRNVS